MEVGFFRLLLLMGEKRREKEYMNRKTFAAIVSGLMTSITLTSGMMASAQEQTYKIGICQLMQHEALELATKGFQDVVT